MRKAARAAGGDFLVVSGTFSQRVTRIGPHVSSTSTFDAVGAVGYAVRHVARDGARLLGSSSAPAPRPRE